MPSGGKEVFGTEAQEMNVKASAKDSDTILKNLFIFPL